MVVARLVDFCAVYSKTSLRREYSMPVSERMVEDNGGSLVLQKKQDELSRNEPYYSKRRRGSAGGKGAAEVSPAHRYQHSHRRLQTVSDTTKCIRSSKK